MEYKTLEKIYYSSPNDYEKIYLERYNGDYTHRLHFDIGGNKAFFIVTPDIQKKMLGIQRMDKTVTASGKGHRAVYKALPYRRACSDEQHRGSQQHSARDV